jgi:hypothetical protein
MIGLTIYVSSLVQIVDVSMSKNLTNVIMDPLQKKGGLFKSNLHKKLNHLV